MEFASELLKGAPPAEVLNVLNDLKVIFRDEQVAEKLQAEDLLAYYMDHFQHVTTPTGKTLLTPYNHLGGTCFFDPVKKVRFEYDGENQTASVIGAYEMDEGDDDDTETIRQRLQSCLDKYLVEHYESGVGVVVVQKQARRVQICFEGHRYNVKNFWNGNWQAWFSASLTDLTSDASETSASSVSGVIGHTKAHVHFYEDANVSLASSAEHAFPLETGCVAGSTEYAEKLFAQIKAKEQAFQEKLNEAYYSMIEDFKNLRRPLPITKTKIDWTKLSHHALSSELRK